MKKNLKASTTCCLYRALNHCFISDSHSEVPEEAVNILGINKSSAGFFIYRIDSNSNSQLWTVVKYLPGGIYELKECDILRMGRVCMTVKKICARIENFCEWTEINETREEKICKICCYEEISENDPLISLCKCSGSLKYIHFSCLKHWLQGKVTIKSLGNVSSYQWSEFSCEICKEKLPEMFIFRGKTLSLLEIEYPNSPYIILEENKLEVNDPQTLYVVGLEETQSIFIGRGTDTEIKLSDISVSRYHARIKYCDQKFFIQDNKSKFGTLIGLCKNLELIEGNDLTIQINRTIVTLSIKKPWSCCIKRKIVPVAFN